MRILKIRFKNLNSLAGEWAIDLTLPAYTANGIFAITGPTGAGKTTILDAICLALYGRTPRLDRVTKSGNEIMSRQTGECFAEVTFETLAGRYRCHWSQRRARGKPDGELQQPKQEIANDETQLLLDTSIRGVAEQIEKVTGMDFDRFTRSMLLAQGGFAAFLQSGPDARAPILEQITGTEIYSQISMQVHLHRAESRTRLDKLETEQASLRMLSETDEGSLRAELETGKQEEARASESQQALASAIHWREQLDRLEGSLGDLGREGEALQLRTNAFLPDRERLERAMRALVLHGDAMILASLRQDQENDMKESDQALQILPLHEAAVQQAQKVQAESEAGRASAKTALRAAQPVLREIRDLDLQVRERTEPIRSAREDVTRLETELAGLCSQNDQDRAAFHERQGEQEALSQRISCTLPDEALVEQMTGIQGRFETLRARDSQITNKREELAQAESQRNLVTEGWTLQNQVHAEKSTILAQMRASFVRIQEERTRVQDGRSAVEWRVALDHAREHLSLLEKAEASVHARISAIEAQTRFDEAFLTLSGEKQTLEQLIREQTARCEALDEKKRLLQTQMALIRQIQTYEEARCQLEDGLPCPLCGASEHPYAAGNVPVSDDAQTELDHATDESRLAETALTGLRVRLAEVQMGIVQTVSRQAEARAAILTETGRIEHFLAVLAPETAAEDVQVSLLRENFAADLIRTSEKTAAVDRLDEEAAELRDALEKCQTGVTEIGRKAQAAEHVKILAEQAAERAKQELQTLDRELRQMMESALLRIQAYGVDSLQIEKLPEVEHALLARREQWVSGQALKAELERQIASLGQQIHAREAQAVSVDSERSERRMTLQRLAEERETLVRARQERFGDKDPEMEEARLSAVADEAEQSAETARQALDVAARTRDACHLRVATLETAMAARTLKLSAAEEAFSRRLTQTGFAGEEDFRSAQMSDSGREMLQMQKQDLESGQSGWDARNRDIHAQFDVERQKAITDLPLGTLLDSRKQAEEEIRTLGQRIGGIGQRLHDNEALGQRRQELMQTIGVQRQEYGRWDTLHELIGSADGKKYRNFAQGITFDMLIGHANQQLQRLTDRYLLVRDDHQPLELSVIDNDQAGEIRSTKNLSGGESFIVSLSLALGLSQMSSRKVRVDSLFLDEGFGTLDEETLETALETLASLHQDGKLIGVISHVPAIRERIGTRIQVVPRSSGKSALVGPGCHEGSIASLSE